MKKCKVCGKEIKGLYATHYCSKECAKAGKRFRAYIWNQKQKNEPIDKFKACKILHDNCTKCYFDDDRDCPL